MTAQQKDLYLEWKRLVNLPTRSLEGFLDNDWGKRAGMRAKDARAQGIHYGRESARAIIDMRSRRPETWTWKNWDWAQRQISFIKRMSGVPGKLVDESGVPTRKYLSLMIWGHDPQLGRNGTGTYQEGYRAWYMDGEWHPLRSGMVHAEWALNYLNDQSLEPEQAIAKLMKSGGIKQWGHSFVMRDFTDKELRIIQRRIVDMVEASPSKHSQMFDVAWGRGKFLQTTAEEFIYAKHVDDLNRVYSRSIDPLSNNRGWILEGEWFPLPDRYTHEDLAHEISKKEEIPVTDGREASELFLKQGGVRVYGKDFQVGAPSRGNLVAIQDYLMDKKYPDDTVLSVLFPPYEPSDLITPTVDNVLTIRNWRELQLMRPNAVNLLQLRTLYWDGRWRNVPTGQYHADVAAEILDMPPGDGYDAERALMSMGAVKQFGEGFTIGNLDRDTLSVIQERIEEAINRNPSVQNSRVTINSPLQHVIATAEDVLMARTMRDLGFSASLMPIQ